jgi:tetratricopeptide (TPR) repeat protein
MNIFARKFIWPANRSILSKHVSCGIFLLVILAVRTPVGAQEELNDDRKIERHKEIAQTMSEPIYKRLGSIHEDLGNNLYEKAITALARLEKISLNNYEEALVMQTYGFAYVQQEQYKLALEYFEKSLATGSLPGAAQQGMLYSLSALYASEGQYIKAIETMRRWFRYEAEPVAAAYMVIASSFTELDRYDDALPYVRKAIEKSDEPNEDWYMLELAIHFERNSYREAISVLKTMVQYWPDTGKYWDMLAGVHMELGQDKDALDTMMVAYAKGLIDDSRRIMALVQLNMVLDIPFTAGIILETELAAGRVEGSKEDLEILLQAWLSSKEYNRAIKVIEQLGSLVGDGAYFMQKAGIHNELGEWELVAAAVQQALDRGLDKPTDAYMLAGMAYSELKQFDKAIAAFRSAREVGNDKQRQNATAWIDFVQDKIAVKSAALN